MVTSVELQAPEHLQDTRRLNPQRKITKERPDPKCFNLAGVFNLVKKMRVIERATKFDEIRINFLQMVSLIFGSNLACIC